MTSVASVITSTPKATLPQIQQLDAMRTTNGYLILQPQQQQDNLVFLPPNHSISYTTPLANIASQVVSMVSTMIKKTPKFCSVAKFDWFNKLKEKTCFFQLKLFNFTIIKTPCLLSTSSVGQQGRQLVPPQIWYPGQSQTTDKDLINVASSQNYIPQGETLAGTIVLNPTGKKLVNGVADGKAASSTAAEATVVGGECFLFVYDSFGAKCHFSLATTCCRQSKWTGTSWTNRYSWRWQRWRHPSKRYCHWSVPYLKRCEFGCFFSNFFFYINYAVIYLVIQETTA